MKIVYKFFEFFKKFEALVFDHLQTLSFQPFLLITDTGVNLYHRLFYNFEGIVIDFVARYVRLAFFSKTIINNFNPLKVLFISFVKKHCFVKQPNSFQKWIFRFICFVLDFFNKVRNCPYQKHIVALETGPVRSDFLKQFFELLQTLLFTDFLYILLI